MSLCGKKLSLIDPQVTLSARILRAEVFCEALRQRIAKNLTLSRRVVSVDADAGSPSPSS